MGGANAGLNLGYRADATVTRGRPRGLEIRAHVVCKRPDGTIRWEDDAVARADFEAAMKVLQSDPTATFVVDARPEPEA